MVPTAIIHNFFKKLKWSKSNRLIGLLNVLIFRARFDTTGLKGSMVGKDRLRICVLCSLQEDETMEHFLGKCQVLKEFRARFFFGKTVLNRMREFNKKTIAQKITWSVVYHRSWIIWSYKCSRASRTCFFF